MVTTTSLLLPVLLAAQTIAAQLAPLLSYSLPKTLLGLEPGMFSHEVQYPATIIFLPGFHSCGTLQFISVPKLTLGMMESLPKEGLLMSEYEEAKTKTMEDGAREDEMIAWAKGWKKSCGRGEAMKRVMVAKVELEGDGEGAMAQLDTAISGHLKQLQSTQRQVILTSLSADSLFELFSLASATPSAPSKQNPTPDDPIKLPTRRRGGMFHRLTRFIFLCLVILAIGYGAVTAKLWWDKRREGRVMLPLTNNSGRDEEELDLEAE